MPTTETALTSAVAALYDDLASAGAKHTSITTPHDHLVCIDVQLATWDWNVRDRCIEAIDRFHQGVVGFASVEFDITDAEQMTVEI